MSFEDRDRLRRRARRRGAEDAALAHESADPVARAASGLGNEGFMQVLARMSDGEGILDGGRIHPDVEAAIGAARGGGVPLEASMRDSLGASYADDLSDVRVHTGEHAQVLARAVSARAFTVGRDVFFARGEYAPRSRSGRELIAHEVAHATQNRGVPQAGPLTVTTPGDAHERAAEDAAKSAID